MPGAVADHPKSSSIFIGVVDGCAAATATRSTRPAATKIGDRVLSIGLTSGEREQSSLHRTATFCQRILGALAESEAIGFGSRLFQVAPSLLQPARQRWRARAQNGSPLHSAGSMSNGCCRRRWKYHLHGYASISLANNNLGKETSYRSSKLLEPSSKLLAVLSIFRDASFSVLSIVRSKSRGKQKYGLPPPRRDVSVSS
jgi:hypothetical protein